MQFYSLKFQIAEMRSAKVIIYMLLFFSSSFLSAQLEAGLKVGASTIQYANPDFETIILSSENTDEYKLSVNDLNFGYHFGLYSRLKIWKIILQPEVLLNSNSVDYKIEDVKNNEVQFLKEQYTSIDIPILLGLKFKWFSLQGGISGHLPILSISELKNIDGYTINNPSFSYSYLGGFGIDFWRFRFDARYELSTDFFGEHINYKGNNFHFPNKDNRIIAGLAYKF